MGKSKFAVIFCFFVFFWLISFAVRVALLVWSFDKADLSFTLLLSIFFKGFVFDTIVAAFFSLPYAVYLLILPQQWNNSFFNRWVTYTGAFLALLIIMFSSFAEVTFWDEFECRFNFIAVDYLVYTYEVVNNINQSYPLPLLISGILIATSFVFWIFVRVGAFQRSFQSHTLFASRLLITLTLGVMVTLAALWLPNSWAEKGDNRYRSELSKAGIYSFFAAFKNNELDYYAFYSLMDENKAIGILRKDLSLPNVRFLDDTTLYRVVAGNGAKHCSHYAALAQQPPNVILITIESFSASFMSAFGNNEGITPCLDSLAQNSIFFTNLYATGTRTVRGMEALALSVPPTPGSSIVRRPDNAGLFNISSVFKSKGYEAVFVYGGDGYFDNMNAFFGNNGFDIIDRKRATSPHDHINGQHTIIPDSCVTFENAWGICDEDIYNAAIRHADEMHKQNKPFFQFIMTTSNHRPYSYPGGKIDIPSGTGRAGAVKYTDYAIRQLISNIQSKPWFKNTVIVIVADHCANSAGRNEISVSKYHIPAIIYNLHGCDSIHTINKQCSQIDVFPTLFALFGWDYKSKFYGADVLSEEFRPRAFIGTYQKLGYVQDNNLVILSPQQKVEELLLNANGTEQQPAAFTDSLLVQQAIAHYQTAYFLFKNKGMKENEK